MYKTLKTLSLFICSATFTLLIFHFWTIAFVLNGAVNHSTQHERNMLNSNQRLSNIN